MSRSICFMHQHLVQIYLHIYIIYVQLAYKCEYIYLHVLSLFLLDILFPLLICSDYLYPFRVVWLEVCFVRYKYSTFLPSDSIYLEYYFSPFHLQSVCVFTSEMNFLHTASSWSLFFKSCSQSASLEESGTGVWTQGLALAREALSHYSHNSIPFCFSYISDRILSFLHRLALDCDPPTSDFQGTVITGICHHV
jgi:hypothetical protein